MRCGARMSRGTQIKHKVHGRRSRMTESSQAPTKCARKTSSRMEAQNEECNNKEEEEKLRRSVVTDYRASHHRNHFKVN